MIRFGEELCTNLDEGLRREWLETNGISGFASSTLNGCNTRRYHGLLVAATKPFIPHFRKLDRHFADGPRAAFFDYVLAHGLAIAELGRRVLTHDDDPLAPVEALLGNVPQ